MPARHKITPAADHVRLGAFLRSARLKAGVSQREFSKKLNLPQSFISKVERGERQLQVLEWITICQHYGIDPVELLRSFIALPRDNEQSAQRVTKGRSKQTENS